MEIYFGSKGVNNYLNVKLGNYEEIGRQGYEYKINMLEENNIAYLMRPVSVSVDGELWLKYDTESTYVLNRLMMRIKPDGELLKIIISQICECMSALGKYLLVPEDLVLNPEYMLYNYAGRELRLIYIPDYGKGIREQLKQLLEYVMRVFDYRDQTGVQNMYRLYDVIADEGFNISDLREYIWHNDGKKYKVMEIGEVRGNENKGNQCISNTESYKVESTVEKDCCVSNKSAECDKKPDKKNIDFKTFMMITNVLALCFMAVKFFCFGKSKLDIYMCIGLLGILIIQAVTYICDREEDVDEAMREYVGDCRDEYVSSDELKADKNMYKAIECYPDIQAKLSDKVSKLVPLTNGALDTIVLEADKDTIIIGRGKKESDYRLPTTQISRIHACIHLKDGGVYLEDKNSTNGTFINSVRIPALNEKRLSRGDIIGFANEEFFVS